jgi:L-rhamnose-H+ transport protein
MSVKSSIVFTMIAGFMNGSYALPTKYMKSWQDENIWLVFSPIAFLLMPCICLPLIDPNVISLISAIPTTVVSVLMIGGLLFGIGMIVFTLSLQFVGIGLSFMLNISASTVIATLLPILWMAPSKLFSKFGLAEISALLFFCIAIISSYAASLHTSDNSQIAKGSISKSNAVRGFALGLVSGVLTSSQGFSYAYATTTLTTKLSGYSSFAIMNTPWILIFSTAFIPYFIFFLCKSISKKSFQNIFSEGSSKYYLCCIVMGILYFGSLLVFGRASASLGKMGVVVAWPMLMIFIILTSNLWSFVHKEWQGSKQIAYFYLSVSLIALVIAIIILSIAAYLNN